MCYADRRSQLRFLLLGCLLAIVYGLCFYVANQSGALASDSLVAASAFIEQLTKDDNFFTPRIRVYEWIFMGEILIVINVVASVFMAVFASVGGKASNRERSGLKLFTALVLVLSGLIFLLGGATLMVVDAVGPVLHQSAIDYCTSPSYELILESLQCGSTVKINDQGQVVNVKPTFPAGCGVSCQEKVAFVVRVDDYCDNFKLLCRSRVYDKISDTRCMLPDQHSPPAMYKSPFPLQASACADFCDRDSLCTGYMMSKVSEGPNRDQQQEYCHVISTTLPGANWIPQHQNELTRPIVEDLSDQGSSASVFTSLVKTLGAEQSVATRRLASPDSVSDSEDLLPGNENHLAKIPTTHAPSHPSVPTPAQAGSLPSPSPALTSYSCHVKGTSKMVEAFMSYTTLFSISSLLYSAVCAIAIACSFGFLCPFKPSAESGGFALCIVNCCGGDDGGIDEEEHSVEMQRDALMGGYYDQDAVE